jgi:outer membrane protein assembly factor BamB
MGAGNNVVSVDISTHKVQWTFYTDDLVLSSPALSDTAVYVGGNNGYLYALDKATGAIIWDYELGDAVTSSPAIDDGMLFIGCDDGNLYAFE